MPAPGALARAGLRRLAGMSLVATTVSIDQADRQCFLERHQGGISDQDHDLYSDSYQRGWNLTATAQVVVGFDASY